MTKTEEALEACKKVLDGIELNTISISSAALLCLRIARLLKDTESIYWLQYETSGYPKEADGLIDDNAWNVAYAHGRGYYNKEKQKVIFCEIASALESEVNSASKALNNFSTAGASVSGEWAATAMHNLTGSVANSTGNLMQLIAKAKAKIATLTASYYDYALKTYIELSFSDTTATIFDAYKEKVNKYLSSLSKDTILKLQAMEDKVNSNNPELYSQAVTTCRRLFIDVATELFNKTFPNYTGKMYKTKSGKEIDISGEHYINKISAVIERMEEKSAKNTIIGSSILYILDWIENLISLQCKGVHSEITKHDAEQCIIHTYICLGDILSMQDN